MFLGVSRADCRAGCWPMRVPNPKQRPFLPKKISALRTTLPFLRTARIRRGTKPLRSNYLVDLSRNPSTKHRLAAKPN
jgi:hypothetical protein